ncbi:MAG TPA: HEAT repeat domain-containing protein [Elusimicrobiota bacterium]|nr:HEAT repeat domain-containing protein [Elusimicrobiota bacterium]
MANDDSQSAAGHPNVGQSSNSFDRARALKLLGAWSAVLLLRLAFDTQSRAIGIFWVVYVGIALSASTYALSFLKRRVPDQRTQFRALTAIFGLHAIYRVLKPVDFIYHPPPDLLGYLPFIGYETMSSAFSRFYIAGIVRSLGAAAPSLIMDAVYAWLAVTLAGAPAVAAEEAVRAEEASQRLNFAAAQLITIALSFAGAVGFYVVFPKTMDMGLSSHPVVFLTCVLLFPGIVSGAFLGMTRVRRLRDMPEFLIAPVATLIARTVLVHAGPPMRLDWAIELYMAVGVFPAALIGTLVGWAAYRQRVWATRLAIAAALVVIGDVAVLSRLPDVSPNYLHPEAQAGELQHIGRFRAARLGRKLGQALDNPDPAVRHGALVLLGANDFAGMETIDKVSKIIVDGDENEFPYAVRALPMVAGDYPYQGLRPFGAHGTDSEKLRVARAIRLIRGMGWYREAPAAGILSPLLQDPNASIRKEAAVSVGAGGQSALGMAPTLMVLATDSDAEVKAAAFDALVGVVDPEAKEILSDWWAWRGGDHSKVLRRRIAVHPPELTAGLVIRLYRLGHTAAFGDLTPLLTTLMTASNKATGPVIWAERAADLRKQKSMGWNITRDQSGVVQFPYHDGIQEALRLLGAPPS